MHTGERQVRVVRQCSATRYSTAQHSTAQHNEPAHAAGHPERTPVAVDLHALAGLPVGAGAALLLRAAAAAALGILVVVVLAVVHHGAALGCSEWRRGGQRVRSDAGPACVAGRPDSREGALRRCAARQAAAWRPAGRAQGCTHPAPRRARAAAAASCGRRRPACGWRGRRPWRRGAWAAAPRPPPPRPPPPRCCRRSSPQSPRSRPARGWWGWSGSGAAGRSAARPGNLAADRHAAASSPQAINPPYRHPAEPATYQHGVDVVVDPLARPPRAPRARRRALGGPAAAAASGGGPPPRRLLLGCLLLCSRCEW